MRRPQSRSQATSAYIGTLDMTLPGGAEASDPFEVAARRAAEHLQRIEDRKPFSDQGFDTLEESVAEYIRSLVLEASRIARRQKADVISANDVDRASSYLFRGQTHAVTQHVGTVGGI